MHLPTQHLQCKNIVTRKPSRYDSAILPSVILYLVCSAEFNYLFIAHYIPLPAHAIFISKFSSSVSCCRSTKRKILLRLADTSSIPSAYPFSAIATNKCTKQRFCSNCEVMILRNSIKSTRSGCQ